MMMKGWNGAMTGKFKQDIVHELWNKKRCLGVRHYMIILKIFRDKKV